jgi:hypothetical protein
MQTIFFIFEDTDDEGPMFLAFASTLPLAVKQCDQVEGRDHDNLFIEEYPVDAPMISGSPTPFVQPLGRYWPSGNRIF